MSDNEKSMLYWDKKIIEWENSIKGDGEYSLIEKVAASFRMPLRYRSNLSLELIKPFVKNKTILELGSASGFFAIELMKLGHPKKIVGIDISTNAVKRANEIARKEGLEDSCFFQQADAANFILPNADISIGLGFLDYLNPNEISKLFGSIKSQYFLFTFSEKRLSFLRLIHIMYLISQKCPKHYYYSKKELIDFVDSNYEDIKFVNHNKMSFGCIIHNLPI